MKKFYQARKDATLRLIIIDYFTALASWIIFWLYRQQAIYESNPEWEPGIRPWSPRDYLIGLVIIPFFWLLIHHLSGAYFDPYRKSRITEIYRTLIASFFGTFIIGITAIANDLEYFYYFLKISSLYFLVQSIFTSFGRILLLNRIKKELISKKYGYNTIIIGSNGKAEKAYLELSNSRNFPLYTLLGFIPVDATAINKMPIPMMGSLTELSEIIEKNDIEEVIIALESTEHERLQEILVALSYKKLYIKILPDLYDVLTGAVKTSNVYDPIFVNINPELLSDWQKVWKRSLDLMVAIIGIILLIPIYFLCALLVKTTSRGPILYAQERIGLFGKPFKIFKFRSMYMDAEKNGPALSKSHDPRITSWGKVMRKWRLDELPQFFNILLGDMSLVGPRPERKFFINQIVKTHPQYRYLHRVKPGITSWGMVQYGYAENVEQMIQRMKYDLLYIENCSLLLDIKIMIFTIKVLFQGRGK